MALAAGLHGAVRFNFSRAGKIDQFGVNFKVRIVVDNDVIRPYRKITGKIVIETRFPIKHKGILIQYEGLCILRYATKFDNRTSFHQGRQNILQGTHPEVDGYQESPVRQIILADGSDDVTYSINPGSVTYPFTLEIPAENLPAPFKNSLGSLVYRLVVYMKSGSIQVETGEKIMRFNGFHNLLDNVEANKPASIENFYKKSVFNRKKLIQVVFSLEKVGFLPGSSVPYILYVKNPKGIPIQTSVQLIMQIKYDASGKRDSPKRKNIIVAVKEKEDMEPQPELVWVDNLFIGDNQEPSYTGHFMYNITYCVQYKVKILDHGVIKGEIPVHIGTCSSTSQALINDALMQGLDVPFHGQGLRRRGSASSTHSSRSHNSATTTYSLPPAYSQLSSRMSSRIGSFETLPPTYDEAELMEHSQGGVSIAVPQMLSPTSEPDTETEDIVEDEDTHTNESDSN